MGTICKKSQIGPHAEITEVLGNYLCKRTDRVPVILSKAKDLKQKGL